MQRARLPLIVVGSAALVLGLTACEKPNPGATVFSGTSSAYEQALCWAPEGQYLDEKSCASDVLDAGGTKQSISVTPGQTIGISVDPVVAAAQVVTDEGLIGKVNVTGLALPSEFKKFIDNGASQAVALWNPIDLGYVGEVTEVKVKLIKKEIAEGFIPVISPVAEGLDNKPYNINADVAAGRVASALRARRLVYMSDVPGLLSAPPDPASLISTLKISQVDDLKKKGVIDKGMRPKVASAVRALEEGVQRVHFIDGRLPHSLLLEIFTDQGIGTEIVHG